ncbi:hypothetical protein [Gulbenkiania mobilis]|uniref:hypothetical protein n=1 Tax=Gulbenkiania mobilis TaxID=397457 RepID=UPI0006BBADE4|nr:hypothetical protein [Gulbenkiania mobilis]
MNDGLYLAYADHHITPRQQPLADWCEVMLRPTNECGCPDCGSSLVDVPAAGYPGNAVDSDGGQV